MSNDIHNFSTVRAVFWALVCCVAGSMTHAMAVDASLLPLPYPASYPSENFAPIRTEIRSIPSVISEPSKDFLEPKGIAFGMLKLNPYATMETTHTDNAARSVSDRKEDYLLEYGIGFNSTFKPKECVSASLSYEFGWHDYVRDSVKDYPSHQASAEVRLDRVGVQGVSLIFSDAFLETSSTNVLENEIIQNSPYLANNSALRAIYQYNRFTISGTYAYTFTNYRLTENTISNYSSHTGTLEGAWKVPNTRLEVFDSFQYQRTLYENQEKSDFDTLTFLSGVRGTYSKLTFSVGTGFTEALALREPTENGGLALNALIGYKPHQRISVEVSASRAFQAGVRTGSSIETDWRAQVQVLLTRRGTLTFSYTRNFEDRLDNTQQLSIAYATRFDYKLTRNAALNVGFTRTERDATATVSDFILNEARVGFRLAW